MRWITFMFAVVALTLSVAVLSAAASSRPSLSIVSSSPLAVHGVHFGARERVRLTFRASKTSVLVVRTSRLGAFTVNAPAGFSLDRCGGGSLAVSASGLHGDTALLRRPLRACAPAAPASPA
ncbi:MAG TPA: hypothetical protein VGM80_01485 [Gaiellaceae bacterium]